MTREELIILTDKPQVSKSEALELAAWYTKETGITVKDCMCTASQRNSIKTKVKKYLNGSN